MFLSCHVRVSEWMLNCESWMSRNSFAQSRREIWSLSDCNWTRTQNHLVGKRTLNHLAKLDAHHIEVVMTVYNLAEYSNNFLKTSGRSWQYYTDEPALSDKGNIIDFLMIAIIMFPLSSKLQDNQETIEQKMLK